MSTSIPLKSVLHAAGLLTGATKPTTTSVTGGGGGDGGAANARPAPIELPDLLRLRLEAFQACCDRFDTQPPIDITRLAEADEDDLKLLTARCALFALHQLQAAEVRDKAQQRVASSAQASTSKAPSAPQAPTFGLRDIKLLQALSSVAARWGISALVDYGVLPSELQDTPASDGARMRVIEEGDPHHEEERRRKLEELAKTSLSLLLPDSQQQSNSGSSNPSPSINNTGRAAPLEVQGIALVHLMLPTTAALLTLDLGDTWASDATAKLLNLPNPSTSMAVLFTLLANKPGRSSSSAGQVRVEASALLSRQLMRPGGVVGLLNVLLGNAESEPQILQLEKVAAVLTTPPSDIDPQLYFANIVPRILSVLRPPPSGQAPPPSYIRALCFCISRLVSKSPAVVETHILPHFRLSGDDIEGQLDLLAVIITNIDPSPVNYAFLLTPIITKLFSMWLFLMDSKGDPVLRTAVESLLSVWGRTLDEHEIVQGVSRMLEDVDNLKWARTESGGIAPRQPESTIMLSDESLDDPSLIKPNPDLVAQWLKSLDRRVVVSQLLIQWLDEVRTMRLEPDQDQDFDLQKRILLRLQLAMKVIDECGSEVIREPSEILPFIDQALETRQQNPREKAATLEREGPSLSLADLKIVDDDEDGDQQEEEAEEFPELEGISSGDELIVTGLTLLLAILEGNETLSFESAPLLRSIDKKLGVLEDHPTPTLSRLARDAKMILSLRRAISQSVSKSQSTSAVDDKTAASRQQYQEALKLLQDPILPIRAQGLAMLRGLMTSDTSFFSTDPALVPAILDIFVQAVQDDDSFLYLNAIQGLSTMADKFGRDIAKRLCAVYLGKDADTVGEGERGKRELDKRLRLGEALVQVVQRASQALPVFVDVLIPPLLHTFRSASLPIALRSSALTILASCAEVSPLSLLPQKLSLVEACLDLLSLESRRATKPSETEAQKDETSDALESRASHPALRRGALLFLSLLMRASPDDFRDGSISKSRLAAVVGYVKDTDEDPLVRHNASIVYDDIQQL